MTREVWKKAIGGRGLRHSDSVKMLQTPLLQIYLLSRRMCRITSSQAYGSLD